MKEAKGCQGGEVSMAALDAPQAYMGPRHRGRGERNEGIHGGVVQAQEGQRGASKVYQDSRALENAKLLAARNGDGNGDSRAEVARLRKQLAACQATLGHAHNELAKEKAGNAELQALHDQHVTQLTQKQELLGQVRTELVRLFSENAALIRKLLAKDLELGQLRGKSEDLEAHLGRMRAAMSGVQAAMQGGPAPCTLPPPFKIPPATGAMHPHLHPVDAADATASNLASAKTSAGLPLSAHELLSQPSLGKRKHGHVQDQPAIQQLLLQHLAKADSAHGAAPGAPSMADLLAVLSSSGDNKLVAPHAAAALELPGLGGHHVGGLYGPAPEAAGRDAILQRLLGAGRAAETPPVSRPPPPLAKRPSAVSETTLGAGLSKDLRDIIEGLPGDWGNKRRRAERAFGGEAEAVSGEFAAPTAEQLQQQSINVLREHLHRSLSRAVAESKPASMPPPLPHAAGTAAAAAAEASIVNAMRASLHDLSGPPATAGAGAARGTGNESDKSDSTADKSGSKGHDVRDGGLAAVKQGLKPIRTSKAAAPRGGGEDGMRVLADAVGLLAGDAEDGGTPASRDMRDLACSAVSDGSMGTPGGSARRHSVSVSKHGRRINPRKGIPMHVMATYALLQLPDHEGNLTEMAQKIEENVSFCKQLDWTPRPGTKTYPRWKDALVGCFKPGRYPHLLKTEKKKESLTVYSLTEAAIPDKSRLNAYLMHDTGSPGTATATFMPSLLSNNFSSEVNAAPGHSGGAAAAARLQAGAGSERGAHD